ncbi:uncharacterized protein L201_001941 [Kwoniella dendrophila CBS 6074]|uniref:Uncharacterized protein n=1 Tax=Kwoniella dendrophila CBS 6074 TaxID=1295534 RepID=A0AAX4JNT9_9TREE
MPSNTLQLFQQLLSVLKIPIKPPSLTSIPPSLLLLTLEIILGEKLNYIPIEFRSYKNEFDELNLVKCLLGIIGDDLLSIDLSLIDPLKLVKVNHCYLTSSSSSTTTSTSINEDGTKEMEVVIMSLIVIAKKRGIKLDTSKKTDQGYFNEIYDNEYNEEELLPLPLKPDISITSPISSSSTQVPSIDVFGLKIADDEEINERYVGIYQNQTIEEPINSDQIQEQQDYYESDISRISDEFDPYYTPTPIPDDPFKSCNIKKNMRNEGLYADHLKPQSNSMSTLRSNSSTSTSGKTVLQCMLEEFGLNPGG